MQLDPKMLNRLLMMNDDQLATLIGQIAGDAGISPEALGLNAKSISDIRQALGSATPEDLERLNLMYEEYRRQNKRL